MNAPEVTLPAGYRITRFYTLARRFPTLIGRLPNGSELPYGPYTVGQFVTAVVLLVGGYWTLPLWGGQRGLLVNAPLLLGVTAGAVMFLRKVPWRGRGPVPILRGAFSSYGSAQGTYRGKALPARQATRVTGRICIADERAMSAASSLLRERRAQLPGQAAQVHQDAAASASASASAQHHVSAGVSTSPPPAPLTAPASAAPAPTSPLTFTARPAPRTARPARPARAAGAASLSGVQRLRQQAGAASTTGSPNTVGPTAQLAAAGSSRKH
ncbi:hypothetical protein [Kineococcus sp. SYSU DK005]|uniref:hypothetical protein n=1 Tax=Kineococcus sp. SYSU DK005 TaxID=3383126 RepID=UPI003D7D2423